ncbi:MAG: polysaccharide deacetylase family protein [Capsulimonadaceae bacterium]
MISRKTWFTALAVVALSQSALVADPQSPAARIEPSVGSGDIVAAQFPRKAAEALDAIERGRYGDAADATSALCASAPESPIARQIRGTLALRIGDIKLAADDFRDAAEHDQANPLNHFGLALCYLTSGESGWKEELASASGCSSLTPDEGADIALLRAYTAFVNGDSREAAQIPASSSDPTAMELRAICTAHADHRTGTVALSRFLATDSGIPRVTEYEGLRLTFLQHPSMIEPAISDPSIQSMWAARITQPPIAGNNSMPPEHGDIPLTPSAINPAIDTIRYTIDSDVAHVAQAAPYAFVWDTRLALNGDHVIRVEQEMDDGSIIGREVRTIRVDNPPDEIIGTDSSTLTPGDYYSLEDRIWSALRPKPSRAVAEIVRARLEGAAGDRARANDDSLVALALDPGLSNHLRRQFHQLGVPLPSRWEVPDDGVWVGDRTHRWVALTFDDGPSAKTGALIDALERVHAAATFFVVGSRVEAAPDMVRRMVAGGFEVENHSYTHPNIAQCLPSMVQSEILRGSVVIHSLTGRYPSFFRPPGGNASNVLATLAHLYGQRLAFWTVDGLKAEEAGSPDALVSFVMRHVRPGAIVLMHNGPEVTVAAVPNLVAALRNAGYQTVTLQEIAPIEVKPAKSHGRYPGGGSRFTGSE